MTVYDNMAFGLKIRKFLKEQIDQRVREAAKMLEIEELLDRKPKALSGGQRQRVAVGRAIVRQPKVFLFDEPLSNLDAKLRVQMRAEISSLHNRLKATMIYVTHDQVEALTMADVIVVMKFGVIMQIGGPLTLYNEPENKFVAGFIGSPPMNFLETVVEADGSDIYVNEGTFRLRSMPPEEAAHPVRRQDSNLRHPPRGRRLQQPRSTVRPSTEQSVSLEPLGSETHVYIITSKSQVIGKIDPTLVPTPDTKISLVPDMARRSSSTSTPNT